MTRTQTKVLLAITLVLAVWRVFEVPGVATAFWDFCVAGVLPGSPHAVPPETIMRGLCVVFAVTIFLLFRKEFVASLPKRAARLQTEQPPSLALASRQPKPIPQSRRTAVVRPPMPPIIVRMPRVAHDSRAIFAQQMLRRLGYVIGWGFYGVSVCGEVLERALRLAGDVVSDIAKRGYDVGERALRRALVALEQAWRWVDPYIRLADRRIEKGVRKSRLASDLLEIIRECWKTIAAVRIKPLEDKIAEDK